MTLILYFRFLRRRLRSGDSGVLAINGIALDRHGSQSKRELKGDNIMLGSSNLRRARRNEKNLPRMLEPNMEPIQSTQSSEVKSS